MASGNQKRSRNYLEIYILYITKVIVQRRDEEKDSSSLGHAQQETSLCA